MAWKSAGLILVLVALGLTIGPRSAAAQSILERLESQIRRQSGQSGQSGQAGQPTNRAGKTTESPSAGPASGAAVSDVPPPPSPPAPSTDSGSLPAPPQGSVDRPYLGIFADDREDRGHGVRVLQVYADGPGAKAGLEPQDLITGAAAMPVRQMSELADILELYKPGDKIALQVQRHGQTKKVEMTLGRRQAAAEAAPSPEPPRLALPGMPSAALAPEPTFRSSASAGGSSSLAAAPAPMPYATTPPPPVPYPSTAAPGLLPSMPGDTGSGGVDSVRVAALERRVADLEHRLNELERMLREKAKTEPPPRPRIFNRATPRPPE